MAGVFDLRSALELLASHPEELRETNHPVDPHAELCGVYRYIGAGGTIQRPTQRGPAMLFNTIKGFPGKRVAIGLFGSRERVGLLLDTPPEKLGRALMHSVNHPVPPEDTAEALCQQCVLRADEEGFDLRTILPAPTNTPEDAGPYITMGLLWARDPETGEEDVTIHRMCLQGKDRLSIWFTPGRHIEVFREKAERMGKALPVSVSIGLDPAVYLAACFEPPVTPLGFNELSIAGALRGQPVRMCSCLTVPAKAVANAEYVLEGMILPNQRIREDANSNTGLSMPEFPGYNGPAAPSLPLMQVTCITHRENPILQTTIGPSEEHVNLAGIPTEASILSMTERAMPGKVLNVYAHRSGGGKFLAVMQCHKANENDEGRQRQAALIAFSAFPELKQVILVDEDVDIFDTDDVLWALTTRYQGDIDTVFIPGVRCHPLDPSQDPRFNPALAHRGISCKTIFDCTVPFRCKAMFARARFLSVDPTPFLLDTGA